MDQQAVIRSFRIAISVFFGVLTVALYVLWVRSYWCCDDVSWGISGGPGYKVISLRGEISGSRYPTREGAVSIGWRHAAVATDKLPPLSSYGQSRLLGFSFEMPYLVVVPQWLMVVVGTCLAIAPWLLQIEFHFSLRTIFISTTLVAIMLGLGVWLAR